jgi:hypothetical protein
MGVLAPIMLEVVVEEVQVQLVVPLQIIMVVQVVLVYLVHL